MGYLFSSYTTYIYSFLIVVASLLPVRYPLQLLFPFQDKIIHFLIYFLLAFLAVNSFWRKKVSKPRIYSFFYAFSLGVFLEVIQYFLPYRSFELWDILANLLGSSIGVSLIIKKSVIGKKCI